MDILALIGLLGLSINFIFFIIVILFFNYSIDFSDEFNEQSLISLIERLLFLFQVGIGELALVSISSKIFTLHIIKIVEVCKDWDGEEWYI